MRLFIIVFTLGVALIGAFLFFINGYAKSPTALSRKEASPSEAWVKSAVIYELFVRDFTPEGTFLAAEKKLPELKALGVTVLWLMPIHPIGKEKRKGTWGSPYAVQDYYGVSPDFGTKDDFKRFVQAAHTEGLKVIIDMVANHTAWDNALVAQHPDWYTQDTTGKIVSPHPDWLDVADLNYGADSLRQYMTAMMVSWIREYDIDGYRCDVAEMVPTDFWRTLVPELKKVKPSLMMLSEGTLPEHHLGCFDLTYSWNVYDALSDMMKGKHTAKFLDEVLENEVRYFPQGSLRMRFNTNHDKNAEDGAPIERYGSVQAAKATAALVFTLGGYETIRGVPMLYNGDEAGNAVRRTLFEKIPVDWTAPSAKEFRAFYQTLLAFRSGSKALTEGAMVKLRSSNDDAVFAFMRKHEKEKVMVVVNLSKAEFTGFIKTDAGNTLTDIFEPEKKLSTKDGNLKLTLGSMAFKVFKVE